VRAARRAYLEGRTVNRSIVRSPLRRLALALAAAGLLLAGLSFVDRDGLGIAGSKSDPTFDPLLDAGGAPVCGPLAIAAPPRLLLAAVTKTETAPFQPQPMQAAGGDVPIYRDLGSLSMRVTTKSPRAQSYFNQGLRLSFAFNHAEAQRAFQAAQRIDPDCAACFWGEALILGPNINVPMAPEANAPALAALAKAVALKDKASAKERALIEALEKRYSADPKAERPALDAAYADAMKAVAARYPADDTVRTLYVEAAMDTQPWDYWQPGGVEPKGRGGEIVANLETVLKRNPSHPGAIHLYIHAVEASTTPERALAGAERLGALMPGAGHIVHMPAHIYMRVGRHADVVKSNQLAAKADEDYIAQCNAQGLYPLGYYPHNVHFIWMGASASGQSRLALESANKMVAAIPKEALASVPILQGYLVVPYWAQVQFGRWSEILAAAPPAHDTPFMRGAWRYARARALVATGRLAEAETELGLLRVTVEDPALKANVTTSNNTGYSVLRIAPEVVAGELAAKRKEWDAALLHLERAVRFEDSLIYTEPADWAQPVRQILGAVLLDAGRPDEAEAIYWEDLRKNPGNAWSLTGLLQALKAQQKDGDAALIQKRLEQTLKDADITIATSRGGA